ncbi:MAG: hydrolase [Calditerrivibrio sp.]|nr:hydrolase [Calditerrivibrio sp.]
MNIYMSQIKPYLGNVEKNLELHEAEINKAISEKCDLIVFPELSLTGYYLRDLVSEVSIRLNSPFIKIFENYSESIAIIIGFVLEDENHNFFNAAAYFENGLLKHIHKKVYLPNYTMFEESRYLASGSEFVSFDILGQKSGILICEDALHLSSLYVYSLQGVKNIIIISNSPARGINKDNFYSQELWYNSIKFIATNMTVNTVFVNRVGVEDGITFWGGSICINSLGEIVARCDLINESNTIAVIEESVIRRSRINSPFYRDEDLSVVKNYLQRVGLL